MSLVIESSAIDRPECINLMGELGREVDQIYGNKESTLSALARMDQPGAAFVLARVDGEAVGCGAIRPLTRKIAEVKRMYVRRACGEQAWPARSWTRWNNSRERAL